MIKGQLLKAFSRISQFSKLSIIIKDALISKPSRMYCQAEEGRQNKTFIYRYLLEVGSLHLYENNFKD